MSLRRKPNPSNPQPFISIFICGAVACFLYSGKEFTTRLHYFLIEKTEKNIYSKGKRSCYFCFTSKIDYSDPQIR